MSSLKHSKLLRQPQMRRNFHLAIYRLIDYIEDRETVLEYYESARGIFKYQIADKGEGDVFNKICGLREYCGNDDENDVFMI